MEFANGIETDQPSCRIDHVQSPTDVQRGGCDHVAPVHHCELRGAAANIDVENADALIVGYLRCTRPIGRQHGLIWCPAVAVTKSPRCSASTLGDGLRILAPQRLPGENDDAGVDFLRLDPGGCIRSIDDGCRASASSIRSSLA